MEKHKRYLVFGCFTYYPLGGLDDLLDTFDSIDECHGLINNDVYDYYYIYDRIEGVKVEFTNE